MMASPVGGDRPASSNSPSASSTQRCRDHPRNFPSKAAGYVAAIELLTRTVSSQVGSRARPVGARTSDRAVSPPGSTPARSPRSARPRNVDHVVWTRPTRSTRWPRPGRCSPNRRSARSRRSRSTTPWWPRSKRCWSGAACWSTCARWSSTTSRISWRNSPPTSATSSPLPARSRAGCAVSSRSTPGVSTLAGAYRLSWLLPLVDQDRAARREIRRLEAELDELLDRHGTTLRDEPGIGPVAAATLIVEVGDPFRFARESKFARWCGVGAVALSSGEGSICPSATVSTSAATVA